MILRVTRKTLNNKCTLGELSIDGKFFCYTLEDVVREYPNKVANETAIWYGVYDVDIDYSPKFRQRMPHVLNVPLFGGIRIHAGNTAVDTSGCILVGMRKEENAVRESRVAYDRLCLLLESAIANGEKIQLEVVKEVEDINGRTI